MTRTTTWLTAPSCAALLAAMGAFGCGSNSTIDNGGGGSSGFGGAKQDSGAIILGGTGGGPAGGTGGRAGGNVDAGVNMCMANSACTMGFTCDVACNVNG